ncbi:MAG: DNA repair protein RecO [Candidatus Yonathbacteria bacterium RIFCSPLOWO2_01_FULL_47_33b]|uniref:DNA repair protein RecO n=1 Tax=Candidatus Yonathbacteria bacterium RIFCSPLOWO2_01_FULL_47_33b TaxID=1802727 RepID=A0A1G2SFL5_9BACT|nr:MAG: DNA repair protein RecO [Candidatus Yonathbacteria bacterium RIFCSPLOWO2_01_FULL_47_33b]
MAHHIYHTRGIILGSVPIGESNRFYKIFTEELGLVGASAQSVRKEESKLRYVLQDFSLINVDLVRGKEVWRITSAGEEKFFPGIKGDTVRLKLFARMCALLSRLIHGEGREDELFQDLLGALSFLEQDAIPDELTLSFETLATLRSLVWLGYLDPGSYERFLEPGMWSREILNDFEKIRTSAIPAINAALHSSQL